MVDINEALSQKGSFYTAAPPYYLDELQLEEYQLKASTLVEHYEAEMTKFIFGQRDPNSDEEWQAFIDEVLANGAQGLVDLVNSGLVK